MSWFATDGEIGTTSATRTLRRVVAAAVACLATAVMILSSISLLFGLPRPLIHIEWQDVSPAEQDALERRLRLATPTALADSRWAYEPLDFSPEMLLAIVEHESVADTGGIDRPALRLEDFGPLSPRRGGVFGDAPRWAAPVAKLLAYGLLAVAAVLLMLARATFTTGRRPSLQELRLAWLALRADPMGALTRCRSRVRRWIQRGVPVASAEAAGLFRIVFGLAVLLFVSTEPVNPALLASYDAAVAQGPYGAAVRWLGAHPSIVQGLGWWLYASGLLFIVGLCTFVSFACFVLGFLVWAAVFTLTTSTHAVAALGLTLVCLLPTRWGTAWSMDALLRRVLGRPRRTAADGQHGYVFWVPRLVFGLAFLAAAWSKVSGGPDWILNGTVKYHFISDLNQALVDWGPWLTQYHWVAVAMSGAAIAVEALVIAAAFSRSITHVLLLGAGALALLAGFALFQGVVWPGWWILLIAFLPWQLVGSVPRTSSQHRSLGLVQLVVVAMLIAQQFVASAFHIEARPLTSAYDMYSATYGSAEEYENASNLEYRVVVYDDGQARDLPDCFVDDRTAVLLPAAAAGGSDERDRFRSLIGPCVETEASFTAFGLEGDRRVYDWNTGRFETRRGLDVIGPFPADWLRP